MAATRPGARAAAYLIAASLACAPGCGSDTSSATATAEAPSSASAPSASGRLAVPSAKANPTFTRDVAPIVFDNCAPCHHDGGAAPFPLISYADVRRRADEIVEMTGKRLMPPWPPVQGHGRFKGERRLADAQIETLARWAQIGTPEGTAGDLPPAPASHRGGWPLGAPDLVLTPDEGWTLPTGGGDVFRNFVVRVPIDRPRFVRALDLQPGHAHIVHHANVLVDESGVGRQRDAREPGVGFSGMDLEIASDRFSPDSHFLFWKPGTPADGAAQTIPWPIEPGTDLILNLHLRPSGRPELVRPSVGVYFTDEAPSQFPMLLQLERDGALDIPAGATAFTVTDELTLPVPVKVLAVYPHAHYLGREVQGIARLPDGTTRWLIHIADWNLDWQAVYDLAEPLSLPAGTVLSMKWVYDNSRANERNPHDPPQHVVAGNRASDEMAHLWIQVLPQRREDLVQLQDALMRARLRKYPGDFVGHANLGSLLLTAGRVDEALVHFRAAVTARPDHSAARNNLGTALRAAGQTAQAMAELSAVARADPSYLPARYNLATMLMASGRAAEAIPHLRAVVGANAADATALNDLGSALAMTGRLREAAAAFEQSLRHRPDNAHAHYNLGLIAARGGRIPEAEAHFERAHEIDPSDKEIEDALEQARAARRK